MVVHRLSALLRRRLRDPNHFVTLREEIEAVQDYLDIEQIRFGSRLSVSKSIATDTLDVIVPSLLLQPLVENCIKHGLEPSVDGGRIDVSAVRDGGMLVLRVRDTGVGLHDSSVEGTRFGLVQVRDRLAALYGARASLTLAPAGDAEGGTLATLRLPIDDPAAA
jgi:LytS/YehU family sensor histidine kinase